MGKNMILSKMLINQVINLHVKNFKLDKLVNYLFEDNELYFSIKSF